MTTLASHEPFQSDTTGLGAATPALPAIPRSDSPEQWAQYFEDIYAGAHGDPALVPWEDARPNPALVAWLNAEAPSIVRPGVSVCIVGCGLGDDVRELADRGYDATGFDVSRTAVQWARQRHPDLAEHLIVADLFALPASLRRRFDLVIEVHTLQSMRPTLWAQGAAGIAALARAHGAVLAICRGRDEGEAHDQPPFALTPEEFTSLFGAVGFGPTRAIDDFEDDEVPPRRRLRAVFRRC